MRRRSPRLPHLAGGHGQAAGARQGQDPPGRHPLRHSRARGACRRLGAVLDAIYAAFAEGWTDPGGTDAARRDLTEEALFLARLVAELLPDEPEALGLLALMLHAEARRRARRTRDGEYVPLAEQDHALWDWPMIDEAEALLRRAAALGVDRPLSAGSRAAVGACLSLPHRAGQLGGGGAALRRAAGAHRLAGRRHQPRAGARRGGRRRRRARRAAGGRPATPGSPSTSPTGRRAPSCWRGPAPRAKRGAPTRWRSGSNATPPCAASCSGGRRHWRADGTAKARKSGTERRRTRRGGRARSASSFARCRSSRR